MNFYSLVLFCIVSLIEVQEKQFVEFKSDEVKISKHQEQITVTLPFEILESYHIQSEKETNNNFIPTEVHFDTPDGFEILEYRFSKVQRENLTLGDLKCEVLSNDLVVTIRLKKKSNTDKTLNLKGYLYYQSCDDRQCFYPRKLYFEFKRSL